jgi:hypothetical protein
VFEIRINCSKWNNRRKWHYYLTKEIWTPRLRWTAEQSRHRYTPYVRVHHVGFLDAQSKHTCCLLHHQLCPTQTGGDDTWQGCPLTRDTPGQCQPADDGAEGHLVLTLSLQPLEAVDNFHFFHFLLRTCSSFLRHVRFHPTCSYLKTYVSILRALVG